ncbi:MAG: hypothetical protein ACE5IL_02110 [Myxococcota bacterium]
MRLSLHTLQRKNALLAALAVLGSIPYGVPAVASVALGGGIQIVNLRVLERSVRMWVLSGEARSSVPAQVFMIARFLLLLAAVGAALALLPVRPLWLLLGLGTLVPAALWHGLDPRSRADGEGA